MRMHMHGHGLASVTGADDLQEAAGPIGDASGKLGLATRVVTKIKREFQNNGTIAGMLCCRNMLLLCRGKSPSTGCSQEYPS